MPAKQQHRFLGVGTSLGDDKLLIRTFTLTEQLSRLHHIEVDLVSEDPAIKFDDLVGTNATVRLELPNRKAR